MSTISTAFNGITTGSCAEIVIDITETALSQANLGTPTGTLGALVSPENKGTFELILDPNKSRPTSGSHRKVYTKDVAPVCNQDTEADGPCATPSFTPDSVASNFKFVEHRIDLSIQRKITMDLEAFKSFCINPKEYLAKRLTAFRQGVLQEINTKLIDRVIAYAGNYADGTNSISAPKNVSFLTSGAGGYLFDPTGYSKIKDEYAKLGHPYTTPFVVGGSQVATLLSNSNFYGGTNFNGVTNYAIPNVGVDYGIDVAFADGDNHLLTWDAGSIQAVGYNDITDDMTALSIPMLREKIRVPDPFGTGLGDWDYYFQVDETGCVYEMRWEKWFDALLPVPYDGTCGKKPVLNFLVDCNGNSCPDSSYSVPA